MREVNIPRRHSGSFRAACSKAIPTDGAPISASPPHRIDGTDILPRPHLARLGIVGVTSDTLIGMRHLGQSWTSPAHIVLGSAVMGRLLHWTNSALEWSFDQEGSRALQHSYLC